MNQQKEIQLKLIELHKKILKKYNDYNYARRVKEYLEYFELGLAFEEICDTLTSSKLSITKNEYEEIKSIGEYFRMDDLWWRDIVVDLTDVE